MTYSYLTSPAEIEKLSFAVIESEAQKPEHLSDLQWKIAVRMIHTCADFDILNNLRFHPDAIESGLSALRNGCTVFTDTEMAAMGISDKRLQPLGIRKICLMRHDMVARMAGEMGITRSMAAVDMFAPDMAGSICVVGNAPTALFRLLGNIGATGLKPALIVGMPVGFVNAAESKDMLVNSSPVPYITLTGRKGGSALAASVVNALLEIARTDMQSAPEAGRDRSSGTP